MRSVVFHLRYRPTISAMAGMRVTLETTRVTTQLLDLVCTLTTVSPDVAAKVRVAVENTAVNDKVGVICL